VIVEVSNLKLFEYHEGFEEFRETIFQCKMNLLLHLSKLYPDANFVFYNILGECGLIEDVEQILSGILKNFELIHEEVYTDFNSSPVNNIPQIKVDGTVQVLDSVETVGLYKLSTPEKLVCNYTTCFYVIENFTTERKGENVKTYVVDVMPQNFLESSLINNLSNVGEKYVILKLLRGEELCL
jgi:hypothetical protein